MAAEKSLTESLEWRRRPGAAEALRSRGRGCANVILRLHLNIQVDQALIVSLISKLMRCRFVMDLLCEAAEELCVVLLTADIDCQIRSQRRVLNKSWALGEKPIAAWGILAHCIHSRAAWNVYF